MSYVDSPGLLKITGNGQESYFKEIFPGPGGLATANFLNDTTLVLLFGCTINGVFHQRWGKADTMGNCTYYKEFPETWMNNTSHTLKTFDNKFVSVSKGTSHIIYLYKLNSDLNYDSIYTHQYAYDSLCPGGVISDTIDPNCDLIVGIDEYTSESDVTRLKVYPNPATSLVTIEFPSYLQISEKKSGMTIQSNFYQWNSTQLQIFDQQGKLIFIRQIPRNQLTLKVDISGWVRGMYYFRLLYKEQDVANAKILLK